MGKLNKACNDRILIGDFSKKSRRKRILAVGLGHESYSYIGSENGRKMITPIKTGERH